jgi:hypothetical protein
MSGCRRGNPRLAFLRNRQPTQALRPRTVGSGDRGLGIERFRWLDRPPVRWGLLVAGWTLWVRLFFQGPLWVFGWTIPDWPWTLIPLGFAVVLLLARNTGWLPDWNPGRWVWPAGAILLIGPAGGVLGPVDRHSPAGGFASGLYGFLLSGP